MKRILSLVLILTLSLGVTFAAKASGISVYIDGTPVAFTDGLPVIEEGRTLVPVRAVSEAMGAKVDWDEEYRVVTLTNPSWKMIYEDKEYLNCYASVRLTLDTRLITISLYDAEGVRVFSTVKEMDCSAKIINGRTYIPARYIGYGLGYAVLWNEAERRIDYNYGGVQNTDITVYTEPWKAPEITGPINVADVLRPYSEFLGEYPNYDEKKDYNLLSVLYREFAYSEASRTTINDFLYTRLPENQYLKDKSRNLVPVGGNGKKTILYFADVIGGLSLYGGQFEAKAELFERDFGAECYIIPVYSDREVDEMKFLGAQTYTGYESFRYMYAGDKSQEILELAKKVGNRPSTFMCFDENGRMMFALDGNYATNIKAYVRYATETNIPIQTSFPVIMQNWFRDKRIEEACIG